MRVLQIHNFYRWGGGEDEAVRSTIALLRQRGISVGEVTRNSADVAPGLRARAQVAVQSLWSRPAYADVRRALRDYRTDVAHVHNVYPMLSPSVLVACRDAGVPLVMTCHNYRLVCPTAGMFRHGDVCHRCTTGVRELWCVAGNCRGNLAESSAYALRGAAARLSGTFATSVSRYIVPSRFAATLLASAGVTSDRVDVVPCLIDAPELAAPPAAGEYIAFAGRLAAEKGVELVLQTAAAMPEVPFKVAGDGPLRGALGAQAPRNVEFVGHLNAPSLAAFYRAARLVLVPSLWYETFGIVPAEAMRQGVPVVASRLGALEELVIDGQTGALFERGNVADLIEKVRSLWSRPLRCAELGARARLRIAAHSGEDAFFDGMMGSYERAIEAGRQRGGAA